MSENGLARQGGLGPSRRAVLAIAGAVTMGACSDGLGGGKAGSTRPPTATARDSRPAGGAGLAAANVRDFGALGDGATDDTAAIQRALDSVRPGGVVNVPAGTYRVSRGGRARFFTFQPGSVLAGEGMETSVFKPVDRAGPWRDFLGPSSDQRGGGGLTVRDLAFDMNTRTNPVAGNPVSEAMPRYVINCPSPTGAHVAVQRCRFTDCSNVNTLYLAGSTIDVLDCEFDGTGAQTSAAWDHSSVYAVARPGGAIHIQGNAFSGTLGSSASRTAIETHGGQQSVTDNRISAYMVGMNVTGIAEAPTDGVEVRRNEIGDALIGVQVWATPYRPASADGRVRAIAIVSNTMVINNDGWRLAGDPLRAPASGVLFTMSDRSSVEQVSIEANSISYLASRARSSDFAYLSAAVSYVGPGELQQLSIRQNTIRNPLSAAILLNGSTQNVIVEGNTVHDPASGSPSAVPDQYRCVLALGGQVQGLTVAGNTVVDDRASSSSTRRTVSQLPGLTVAGSVDVQRP